MTKMCRVVSPKIVYNVNICVFNIKELLTHQKLELFVIGSTEITAKTDKDINYSCVEYYRYCGDSGKCMLYSHLSVNKI